MNNLIYACAIYSVILAVFHLFFWKLFKWKIELRKLSKPNRAVMQILNLRLIYYFIFVAVLCFVYPSELHSTNLGKAFILGNSLFWAGRTIEQFVFLRINHPLVHLLTFIFILGAVLFSLPLIL